MYVYIDMIINAFEHMKFVIRYYADQCFFYFYFPEENIDETYGVNVQIEESDEEVLFLVLDLLFCGFICFWSG